MDVRGTLEQLLKEGEKKINAHRSLSFRLSIKTFLFYTFFKIYNYYFIIIIIFKRNLSTTKSTYKIVRDESSYLLLNLKLKNLVFFFATYVKNVLLLKPFSPLGFFFLIAREVHQMLSILTFPFPLISRLCGF